MISSRRNFLRSGALACLGFPLISAFSGRNGQDNRHTIKPPALKAGDTVAISSPAGAVWDPKQAESFSAILRNLGFRIRYGRTLVEHFGYLAGSDKLRADELNSFFADKEVKAVFCMKGGWGCARLLDLLDYETISSNPKVIIGFSDITCLLVAIQARTGLVTYHGPVGNSGWNDYTTGYLKRILMNNEKVSFLPGPGDGDVPRTIRAGKATGALIGGNLSVLSGMMGSDYLPSWKNKILFLEDTGEEPYRIDRMLTQLDLCGVLKQISGFVFGKCVKCNAEESEKAFTFNEVLDQHILPLQIPAFSGAMTGHIENKITLPLGILAGIDAAAGTITLLESAMKD